MNKQEYEREVRKAQKLQKTGDEFYWYAYQVGLKEVFQPFLSRGELNHYARYAWSKSPVEVQKNRGFVDGCTIARSKTKVGRPSASADGAPAVAFTIRLPQGIIDLIPVEKSKKRQWVQKVIESILNQCECDVPRLPTGFTTTDPPHICDNCKKPIYRFRNNGATFPWEPREDNGKKPDKSGCYPPQLLERNYSAAQCPTPKKAKK